jgi:hypothetical protein
MPDDVDTIARGRELVTLLAQYLSDANAEQILVDLEHFSDCVLQREVLLDHQPSTTTGLRLTVREQTIVVLHVPGEQMAIKRAALGFYFSSFHLLHPCNLFAICNSKP